MKLINKDTQSNDHRELRNTNFDYKIHTQIRQTENTLKIQNKVRSAPLNIEKNICIYKVKIEQ